MVRCTRVWSDKASPTKNGVGHAWIHRLNQPITVTVPTVKPKRHTRKKLREMAAEMFENGRDKLPWLAEHLGVTVESLVSLRVGYSQGAYSFPEVDGTNGKVIGITFRSPTGRKWCEKGSARGLALPSRCLPGSVVFAVEGASCVAACLSRNYNAVGRPTCAGGVADLAAALPRFYAGCQVIVVGENDKKPRESRNEWPCGYCGKCMLCYPGLAGARAVVAGLLEAGVGTTMAMPKPGFKDCRDILNKTGSISLDDFDAEGGAIQRPLRFSFR